MGKGGNLRVMESLWYFKVICQEVSPIEKAMSWQYPSCYSNSVVYQEIQWSIDCLGCRIVEGGHTVSHHKCIHCRETEYKADRGIPLVVKGGERGPIFLTAGVTALLRTLWCICENSMEVKELGRHEKGQ